MAFAQKRFSIITLTILFAAVFALPVFAEAATSPGVKPGNFFYFFDTSFEKIGLFFTFNPEKKARRALQYADERLAEIEVIAEEKDTDAVKTAIGNYENNVALAAEKSKEVADKAKAESLLTSIEDKTEKNQEVLANVLTKVPEEAREAILRAISASRKGQEEAAKQIAELNGEVEKLKQEVEELKAKEEKRQKMEGSNRASPQTAEPTQSVISETVKIPQQVTTPVLMQTQRNIYPINPLPNISGYSQELQQQIRTAYSRFLSTPDIQYKTQDEQSKFFGALLEEEVARSKAAIDAVLERQQQESLKRMETDLSNAANTKAQSIGVLNQILSDMRSIETDETNEINRMNSFLNSLIGKNDYASGLLRELTTLRRDRLIAVQGVSRAYISIVENLKRTTENTDVLAFLNFNPNQAFADDIKFVNEARAAFQADKANYDDSVRTYLSI